MKYLAENKKARFEYDIMETYEAGIVLNGSEVKSVKTGRANLAGAFVVAKPDGASLINAKIPPYQPKNTPLDYNPSRSRRLLLRKEELAYLLGKSSSNGLTIVPLSIYNKNRRLKVLIGLARHKKQSDKRESVKKREAEREIRRTLRE